MLEMRFQASARQWLMIGVLAAALIAVVVMNLAPNSAEPAVALAVQPATLDPGKAVAASPANVSKLPRFTAAEVAQFNPFARPESRLAMAASRDTIDSAAVRKQQQEKILAELRNAGVRFIIGDAEGGTAMLGNQRIRTGDIVSGFRVIKIDPSGVELEPAE